MHVAKLAIVLAALTGGHSACGDIPQAPEVYDHVPPHTYIVFEEAPYYDLDRRCRAEFGAAPAFRGIHIEACSGIKAGVWTVVLPRIDGRNVTYAAWACFAHHEFAHINGWPRDHPGARFV